VLFWGVTRDSVRFDVVRSKVTVKRRENAQIVFLVVTPLQVARFTLSRDQNVQIPAAGISAVSRTRTVAFLVDIATISVLALVCFLCYELTISVTPPSWRSYVMVYSVILSVVSKQDETHERVNERRPNTVAMGKR